MPARDSRARSRNRSPRVQDKVDSNLGDRGSNHGTSDRNGNQNSTSAAPAPDKQGAKGTTIWVGGLPSEVGEDKIRDVFSRYGRIQDVRMKVSGQGPPFAFVEYSHSQDATDAIRLADQSTDFGPGPIKVNMSNSLESRKNDRDFGGQSSKGYGKRSDSRGRKGYGAYGGGKGNGYGNSGGYGNSRRGDSRGRRNDSRGRGGTKGGSKGYGGYGSNSYGNGYGSGGYGGKDSYGKSGSKPVGKGIVRVGDHKITIEHLPGDMTWTELKEMGRQYINAGELTFARTYSNRDGVSCGILEFKDLADAETVISKLDGKKIKGHDQRLVVRHGGQDTRGRR